MQNPFAGRKAVLATMHKKKQVITPLFKKALHALELTGAEIAIAGEGSFGPDPNFTLIGSNFEIVLLMDRKLRLEVIGKHITNQLILW
ncbi:hypothetical protein GF376_01410 [Candidatus Peregrinibacteria bacterium]|nr:hypothetical protein [Candidatus Peregrinibacteria bacterium]